MRNKKTAGISLVALIVTIIVLIILTAAVIVTFMEGGIIEKAKEAVFKSDIRTYQEILAVKNAENQIELATGNGEGTLLNGTTLEEIQEIIPEFKEEYEDLIAISNGEIVLGSRTEELYSIWLGELGIKNVATEIPENSIVKILQVGHYVDYNLVGGTYTIAEEERNWIYNDLDNGSDYNTSDFDDGEEIIEYKNIMWRVLKNDGNIVTLVSADGVENIALGGAQAFLNGPTRLNDICRIVYGGRNLNIEDVNEILKMDPLPAYFNCDGEKFEMNYGATMGDAIDAEGIEIDENIWKTPDSNFRNYDLWYCYQKSEVTEASETEKDLIFNNSSYWLASSSVCLYIDSYVDTCYGVGVCDGTYVRKGNSNYWATMGDEYVTAALRPVITLNSSLKISDTNTGDGSSAEKAWQLK